MDVNAAHQIINARAVAALGATPIVFDNDASPEGDVEYARLTFAGIEDRQASLGGPGVRRFERRELLSVRFHALRDLGSSSTDDIAQALRTSFEGYRSGELWVQHTVPRFAGYNGKFRLTDIEVTFNYHEIK